MCIISGFAILFIISSVLLEIGTCWEAMNDVLTTGVYRSPLADPKARGVVSGLSLDASPEDLALLYLATVQSIAYGTKHLVDHCNAHGLKVDRNENNFAFRQCALFHSFP